MRKGFDGLSPLVEQQLGGQLKVPYFDGTGAFAAHQTPLQGALRQALGTGGSAERGSEVAELSLFLESRELAGRWKLSPPAFEEKELAVAPVV
jgi:transposase